MDLRWLDPADPAPRDLAGAVAVLDAARAVDSPYRLADTVSSVRTRLRHGTDGEAGAMAVAHDGGRVVGVLEVELPRWDNHHLGSVDVVVDPLRRRQGFGRQLFAAGTTVLRDDGRRVVVTDGWDAPAATAFAATLGLARVGEEVERRQDVATLDPEVLAALRAQAEPHASAYRLVRLPTWTPDSRLAELAALTSVINDAPTDDLDVEDEVFPPERIRTFEAAQLAHGRRTYRLAAIPRHGGGLVGQTMVAVDSERPGHGRQYDTSVCREHRGHRLGLLLKLEMLRWLAESEPQLRVLDTWNAASNQAMIVVNEALGYRVMGRAVLWQRSLDVGGARSQPGSSSDRAG